MIRQHKLPGSAAADRSLGTTDRTVRRCVLTLTVSSIRSDNLILRRSCCGHFQHSSRRLSYRFITKQSRRRISTSRRPRRRRRSSTRTFIAHIMDSVTTGSKGIFVLLHPNDRMQYMLNVDRTGAMSLLALAKTRISDGRKTICVPGTTVAGGAACGVMSSASPISRKASPASIDASPAVPGFINATADLELMIPSHYAPSARSCSWAGDTAFGHHHDQVEHLLE
jgi:hypothetical protein